MGYDFMFNQIMPYLPILLDGLKISIYITGIGILFGSLIGILCALVSTSGVKLLNKVVNAYIEIFRNTPLLIQMYLFFFGLGQFQIHLSPMNAAVLALVLNNGAYTAVMFSSGIKAVDFGQKEAANALGMTTIQTYLHILLPQAFRMIVPPLTNQFISLFLFSSVAATISVPELLGQTLHIDSLTMRTFEVFIVTTILYLAVTTVISVSSNAYEKSFKY